MAGKRKTNALDSFTGAKKALGGTVGKPQDEREQEVWTPDFIWSAVREAFGGVIECDPCAASTPEGWRARLNVTKPGAFDGLITHNGMTGVSLNSLGEDWDFPSIYVNPPFNDLRSWIAACARAAQAGRKVVLLTPARQRRKWWCDLTQTGQRVMLAGVKFVGFKQPHPENMCLVSWNCTIPPLGGLENERLPSLVELISVGLRGAA